MYPLIRLIAVSLSASKAPPLAPQGTGEIEFVCRPWDIDMFMEMNNGRILTLYDLGRTDFAIRTGLGKALKEHKWGLVVAGSTIRYRKRIRMFDRVSMHTKVIGIDERWVYIKQSMWVAGEPASSVLLRTGVTSKGKVVNPDIVLAAMGIEDWRPEPDTWAKAWIESEHQRPWPPMQGDI